MGKKDNKKERKIVIRTPPHAKDDEVTWMRRSRSRRIKTGIGFMIGL